MSHRLGKWSGGGESNWLDKFVGNEDSPNGVSLGVFWCDVPVVRGGWWWSPHGREVIRGVPVAGG